MKTNTVQKNIPSGWLLKKLSDVLDYERPDNYIVKSTSYSSNNKIPVLTANKSFVLGYTDEDFGIYTNTPAIIFDDFTTDSKFVDFPFKVKSSAIKILKEKNLNINLRFFYEKMKSVNFPTGSHKRFYISQYQNMEVLVPPFLEQQKIAEILGTVDEDIAKTQEVIEATEKLKKGLMQQLFTRGIGHTKFKETKIGKIPEEWVSVSLSSVGEVVTGNTPKTSDKSNYGDDFLWVSPKDVGITKYIYDSENKLSNKGFNLTRKLPAGAVLVVCIGSTIGKIAIAGVDLSTNQQINSVMVKNDYSNEFIYYQLLHRRQDIIGRRSTQAVPIINKTDFSQTELAIPKTKDEQKEIAEILSAVDEKISVNKKLKEKLTLLKKGLMQDLLSGRVRTI